MNAAEQELIDSAVGLKAALVKVKSAITTCETKLIGPGRATTLKKLEQARDNLTAMLNDVRAQLRRRARA